MQPNKEKKKAPPLVDERQDPRKSKSTGKEMEMQGGRVRKEKEWEEERHASVGGGNQLFH